MKYITCCSICGAMLSKSEEGTESEVKCPRCKSLLSYVVKNKKVTISLLELKEA